MILSTMRAAKRERRLRLFLEMAPLVKMPRILGSEPEKRLANLPSPRRHQQLRPYKPRRLLANG
uniref:Uncharacterized protein n=2 Tax=Macrostomum lignano TaxID=282301 RepID=A0A1I8FSK0_9PLAT